MSEPWIYRFTLQSQNAEHALMYSPQRLASNKALQGLDAKRELTQR